MPTPLTKTLLAGLALFEYGEESTSMYIVKSGTLGIYHAQGTTEIPIGKVEAGDLVGEMGFFDRKPRSATARAITDVTLVELPYRSFQVEFESSPEWLKAVVKSIISHLKEANERLQILQTQIDSTRSRS